MAAKFDVALAAGDLDPDEASGRESMYSPASSYSTYSREVKYIFEPQDVEEDNLDEYPDYSHIGSRAMTASKQQQQLNNSNNNFLSHTPRTLSASSSHFSDGGGGVGNKENHTPSSQYHYNNRNSQRRGHDRGPIGPGMEEALYSSTSTFTGYSDNCKPNTYGLPRKNSTMSDHSYFSAAPSSQGAILPGCEHPSDRSKVAHDRHHHPFRNQQHQHQQQQQHHMAHSKHGYPTWRSSFGCGSSAGYHNIGTNSFYRAGNQQHQGDLNGAMLHRERHSSAASNASSGPDGVKCESHNAPHHHISQQYSNNQQHQHHQPLSNHSINNHNCQSRLPQPPYPLPPRYNHQAHRRRKTWSPPVMKLGPLAASSSAIAEGAHAPDGSSSNMTNGNGANPRPFYSNDSLLDHLAAEDGSRSKVERKTQSLSEDLDVTPPRLAPISGVLAQKPGPNLIRPIAFKPTNSNSPARSPITNVPHRLSESDSKGLNHPLSRSQPPALQTARGHTTKLGTAVLGQEPLSPNECNIGSSIPSAGSGAFGKLEDSAFSSEARLTTFAEQPASRVNTALSPSSPQTGQFPPPHNSFSSVPHSDNSIYKNITPATAGTQQHQQHPSTEDANTSYSSFAGEFPHSDSVCAPQALTTGYPVHSNTTLPPSSHQSYHGQQQQQHRVAAGAGETNLLQTPSPSDSGVGEHEAILREKDAEINTLREVMDRNERAIFQVYEERRHVWLTDTRKLQDDYERKLKVQSRKSYKTEQVLSLQVYKLQQEQKSLQEDMAKVNQERDALTQRLKDEQAEVLSLKRQLGLASPPAQAAAPISGSADNTPEKAESMQAAQVSKNTSVSPVSNEQDENTASDEGSAQTLQRELVMKNKEIIQLRSKLANFEADLNKANRELSDKAREIASCNDKVKSLQEDLHRAKNPPQMTETGSQTHSAASQVVTSENLVRPSLLGKQERTIEELQEEMLVLHAHIEELKAQQEEERKQWLDEKNKVVRYQKQLQLNYVQMQRKNTTLETEVQQLTLELENRDMKLTALNGEESVC